VHILIVDDHPLFSDGLKLLLLQVEPRADVACCRNGEQALQLVRRRRLDLVLLDWWLGSEPSGLELLQALRQAQPMARVVVVSADATQRRIVSAISSAPVLPVPGSTAANSSPP